MAGCTANVLLITPTAIISANAGDSRAVLRTSEVDFAIQLNNLIFSNSKIKFMIFRNRWLFLKIINLKTSLNFTESKKLVATVNNVFSGGWPSEWQS